MKVLLALVVVAVTVYAVVDCINADDEDRRGLPKGLWLILIVLLPIFGAVAWFLLSSAQRRARLAAGRGPMSGGYSAPGSSSRGPRPRTSGPVAPDDDPDFLWRIEQERRRAAREGRAGKPDDTTPDNTTPGDGDAPDDEPPSAPNPA